MKTKLLCLLLALVMLLSLVACNKTDDQTNGDITAGKPYTPEEADTTTTEHYLPETLFAAVSTEFAKKNATDFPVLDYADAPFSIADAAFAGKKITAISLPVRKTGAADETGKLEFTLYVMPNSYTSLIDAKMTGVTKHTVKIDPADYGLEANKSTVCQYITVDLSSYDLQLTNQQTIAIGSKTDTIQISAMNTRATGSNTPDVIKTWREDWLTTGYHFKLFTGEEGKDAGGLQYSRNTLPVDFVFDYGTPEAKKAVVDARKAEADAYAAKLKALAAAYDGKYLSMIGDSISSFTGVTNDTDYNAALYNNRTYYSTTQMNDYTQMYWGRLVKECGMELCVPNGWSSSKVYGGGSGAPKVDEANASKSDNMLTRSTTLHNNQNQKPDVILLYMGINDVSSKHWSDLYTLLTASGRTKTDKEIVAEWLTGVHHTYENNKGQIVPGETYTSWEAAYALSLERMQYNYPDAEIYIINLTRSHHGSGTEEKINKANTCLAALAAYYGVDIIDQANSEVTYENCHYYGADEANPTALHPNIRGHAALTKLIVEKLYEKLPK